MGALPSSVDLLRHILEFHSVPLDITEYFSEVLGGVVLPDKTDGPITFPISCSIEEVPHYVGVILMKFGIACTVRIPMYFQVVNIFGGPYDESREPSGEIEM